MRRLCVIRRVVPVGVAIVMATDSHHSERIATCRAECSNLGQYVAREGSALPL